MAGPWMAPLIGGAAGLIGDLANQGFAQGMVQQQEAFQERMADSQYQRGVLDMEKAGLNPALMYGSASPAPSPSGAMSQAQPFNVGGNVVGMLQSAAQIANLRAQTHKTELEAQGQDIENYTNSLGVDAQGGTGYMSGEGGGRSFVTGPTFVPWRAQLMRNNVLLANSGKELNESNAALNRVALPAARIAGSGFGGAVDLGSKIGRVVSQFMGAF